jgi:hypothetical protein
MAASLRWITCCLTTSFVINYEISPNHIASTIDLKIVYAVRFLMKCLFSSQLLLAENRMLTILEIANGDKFSIHPDRTIRWDNGDEMVEKGVSV